MLPPYRFRKTVSYVLLEQRTLIQRIHFTGVRRERNRRSQALLLRRLTENAQRHLELALRESSNQKLRSVMNQFGIFAAEIPNRALFLKPSVQGSVLENSHNEWTLILFAEWLKVKISKKTHQPISAKSIASYVSMVKTHLSRTYGFEIAAGACQLPGIMKAMIRIEDKNAIRKKRVGIRCNHLKKAYPTLKGERSGIAHSAMIATAWKTLARSGEICNKGLRRSDLLWVKRTKKVKAHVVLWLRPLKKCKDADAARVPIMISKEDKSGADAYHLLKQMVLDDPIPPRDREKTPLFRCTSGKHINKPINKTTFVKVAKRVAQLNGLMVKWVAGHSPRIGGATDHMANATGDSRHSLRASGRWAGDIGDIYARQTRKAQLLASSQMHGDGGEDLEEIFPAYTQAA